MSTPSVSGLSRSFSVPTRCTSCEKLYFFKKYRCKHCRYQHRKKVLNPGSRRQSRGISIRGEEHWSKVLQANEVNSNVDLSNSRRPLSIRPNACDVEQHGVIRRLVTRFCRWAERKAAITNRDVLASMTSSLENAAASEKLLPTAECSDPLLCTCRPSVSSDDSWSLSCGDKSHSLSPIAALSSQICTQCGCDAASRPRCHSMPQRASRPAALPTTVSSRAASSCSNGGSLSLLPSNDSNGARSTHPPQSLDVLLYPVSDDCVAMQHGSTLVPCCEGNSAAREVSVMTMTPTHREAKRNATWPHTHKDAASSSPPQNETLNQSLLSDVSSASPLEEDVFLSDSNNDGDRLLGDYAIPYNSLHFNECVRKSNNHKIYKGHWHGAVMIHIFSHKDLNEASAFFDDVTRLSRVRHENVALFMGACLQAPNLAVVTSERKGHTLYERVHLRDTPVSGNSKTLIARQTVQALSYLHSRGMAVKSLSSRNIVLESKVKLCLMDYGSMEEKFERFGYGGISRGTLEYKSPEELKTLKINWPGVTLTQSGSTESDVYAFGTILYELVKGQYPMSGYQPHEIIYSVAKGQRSDTSVLSCSSGVRDLINKCWSHSPELRPRITTIAKIICLQKSCLSKQQSLSEPEKLDKLSLAKDGRAIFS